MLKDSWVLLWLQNNVFSTNIRYSKKNITYIKHGHIEQMIDNVDGWRVK